MNDYSDLIYLIGAMIVFSMLSLNATRMMVESDQLQAGAEIEYNAIAIAQDYIDEIKWIGKEDSLTSKIASFPNSVTNDIGGEPMTFYIDIDVQDVNIPDSNVDNKLITVAIKNKYLGSGSETDQGNSIEIKQRFLKSF
jgi:hypothetical protein